MPANPYRIRTQNGKVVTLVSRRGKVYLGIDESPLDPATTALDDNDVIRLAGWLTKWYTDQEAAKKATRRPRKAKKND